MPTILGYSNDDIDFYNFNATVDTTNIAARGFDATIVKSMLSRRLQAAAAEMFRAYLTDQNWGGAARSDIRIQTYTRFECIGPIHGQGDALIIADIAGGRQLVKVTRGATEATAGANYYGLYYWSGSAWVAIGAPVPVSQTVPQWHTFTIKIAASGGVIQWHINGALMASLSGNTLFTASTTFDCIQWWDPPTGSNGWGTYIDHCEIIMASWDYMTYGLRVASGQVTGAGTYGTQVSGVYTDVDELVLNTGDGITFDTALQKATFNVSDLPSILATSPIMDVRVAANVRRGATGPQNATLLLNQAAGLQASPAPIAINGIGFTTIAQRFPVDFNGVAFSPTVYNASEPGVRAET